MNQSLYRVLSKFPKTNKLQLKCLKTGGTVYAHPRLPMENFVVGNIVSYKDIFGGDNNEK